MTGYGVPIVASTPANIPGGYVLIARKLFLSELMNKPPLYFKLWAWMLDRANWKDRDKLRRGQLVATIAEMQEAMSYRVGFRKITPTKDEIRSAYEAFVKATMITTMKTTRGMIITICNYDRYQNPKNYEAHSEAHNETPVKPTVTPHDTEEGLKKEKKGSKSLSSEALRLSEKLANLILGNNAGNTSLVDGKRSATVAGWAADIEKLNRLDRQSWERIEAVVEWSQEDSFWSSNILSGKKLREKFDQLTAKMAVKPLGGRAGQREQQADRNRGVV